MIVKVIIKRDVAEGKEKEFFSQLKLLRFNAMDQQGYISGETLRNIEHPEECLVISNWETLEDWKNWLQSKEREAINSRIEALAGDPTEYNIYENMVGRPTP